MKSAAGRSLVAPLRAAAQTLGAPAGSAADFSRQIVVPQCCVVVGCLAVGLALDESLAALFVRIGFVMYLAAAGVAVHAIRRPVTIGVLCLHTAALAAALAAAQQTWALDPLTAVLAPLIGFLAPLAAWRLPRAALAGLTGLSLLVGAIACRGAPLWSDAVLGWCLLAAMGAAAWVRSPRQLSHHAVSFPESDGSRESTCGQAAAPQLLTTQDTGVMRRRAASREFAADAVLRLAAVGAACAYLAFSSLVSETDRGPAGALLWLAGLGASAGALLFVISVKDIAGALRAYAAAGLGLSGVSLAAAAASPDKSAALGFGALLLAVWVAAPLPREYRRGFALCAVGLAACAAPLSAAVLPAVLGGALVLLLTVHSSWRGWIGVAHRTAVLVLRRVGDANPASATMLRVLAQQLGFIAEARRVLLVFGDAAAEISVGGRIEPSRVDAAFARSLVQTVDALGRDEAFISVAGLDQRFLAPCVDWFGFVPRELYTVRITAFVDARETPVKIVVPIAGLPFTLGRVPLERALAGAAALGRTWLHAAQARFVSSDMLVSTQQTISSREEELNHLVHLVNNIAQDIAAACEDLRRAGRGGTPGVGEAADEIEQLVRSLSAGVSDVKLLKELLAVSVFQGQDAVSLAAVSEEIGTFGRARARRAGKAFAVRPAAEPLESAVQVVSRDYFFMVMRYLVRQSDARSSAGGESYLSMRRVEGGIEIAVGDAGAPLESDAVRRAIAGGKNESGSRDFQIERAAVHLARLSGGAFVVESAPGKTEFILRLTAVRPVQRGAPRSEGFVLLVDDNPQAALFYARAAEALELPYFTAATLSEAADVVARHGRPRLVVTDVQLGEENGLALVRSIRQSYGESVPIVVVSGYSGGDAAEEAKSAGATVYLSKPVGRARLLHEMSALARCSKGELR